MALLCRAVAGLRGFARILMPMLPCRAHCRLCEFRLAAMTRILIYDTTLRDGSQGEGVNFSLQDKLLITARLDEAGI